MVSVPALHRIEGVVAQRAASAGPAEETGATASPAPGALIGRIRVPRIGLDAAVFEGTTPGVLRRGPGHVPGTALPGAGGNCVVAAHRDSFFRALSRARAGDRLVFQSEGEGIAREYRLAQSRIVAPTAVEVLETTAGEQLTLVTCYPFSWVGPAPSRLVWVALPVGSATLETADAGTRARRASSAPR